MTKPFSQYGVQSSSLDVGVSGKFDLNTACQNSITPLKLSLSQLTTLRWSLADEVLHFKQTGFDAIGMWRPKLVEFGEQQTAEILQQARLPVSSLSFAGGFTGGCGLTYLEAVADGRIAIHQARTVGAENVIMVGGCQNGHTTRHSRRMVVDALRELGDVAGMAQVKLALLPMHRFFRQRWTFLNTLDQTLDILSDIDHPHVELAFDTYHLWQEPRLIERIAEIAPLTGIVQLSDSAGSPTSEHDRLLPGDGDIPLPKIIQAFQLAGYSGYFDVQVWSESVWKSNYSHQIEQCQAEVKAMALCTAVNQ